MHRPQRIAIVAITRHGAEQIVQLGNLLADAELFVSERFLPLLQGVSNPVQPITPPLRNAIGPLFNGYDQLLLLFSIGAAVRLIAPHLRSKEEDPGVLVINDAGNFVIPILSGHRGGANAFASELSRMTGATAVLTTASESLGTLPVDILGRELRWRVEAPKQTLVRVAAAVVNGEPVALVQECGSRQWWNREGPLPDNIHLFDRFEQVKMEQFSALLWVTRRTIERALHHQLRDRLVIYRPPLQVVLGIGCDRGTSLETIETGLMQALELAGLHRQQVQAIATIDKKSDEAGMLALAERHQWPLHFYSAEQLAAVEVANPSATVMKYMGTPSVGEAAALLLAGATRQQLLVEKHKHLGADRRNVTVSVVPIDD